MNTAAQTPLSESTTKAGRNRRAGKAVLAGAVAAAIGRLEPKRGRGRPNARPSRKVNDHVKLVFVEDRPQRALRTQVEHVRVVGRELARDREQLLRRVPTGAEFLGLGWREIPLHVSSLFVGPPR